MSSHFHWDFVRVTWNNSWITVVHIINCIIEYHMVSYNNNYSCLSVPLLSPRPWASYQIRKIAGCACAGNAGYVFPSRRIQRKPLVSDPGMPHGTCVTHVPWGMSGSLTCGDGENVPGIPGACAPAILRIWQKVHTLQINHPERKLLFVGMRRCSDIPINSKRTVTVCRALLCRFT